MRINSRFYRSVRTLEDAKLHSQDRLLTTCLIRGFIALMTVPGLVLAATYRNPPLYALVLEICIVQIVLHLHAKGGLSAQTVRHTLQSTDPLTGFISADAFKGIVSRVWNEVLEDKTDVAMAYLQIYDSVSRYAVGVEQAKAQCRLRVF